MNFKVLFIEDDFEKYRKDIEEFCKKAEEETTLIKTKNNMRYSDWLKYPESLLNRLYYKKKYNSGNGAITLVYDNDGVCMFAGIEKHNKDVAIMAKRYYVLSKYRKRGTYLNDFILPPQIDWAKRNGFKLCLITINKYQERTVLQIFKRAQKQSCVILGKRAYPKRRNLYLHMKVLPKTFFINGEDQHIILHKLQDCNEEDLLNEI